MLIADHLAALRTEGELLASTVTGVPLDTQVPTCPDWTVRDLVAHLGMVHRWARSYVADGRTTPRGDDDDPDVGPRPGDDGLLGWYREGLADLVETLASAPAELACWTFLAAPSPLAFWARRQAHETAVHRADAQRAAQVPPDAIGYPAAFAADGIDELICGFFARTRGSLRSDPARTLAVVTDDTGDAWSIRIGPEGREVGRGAVAADCVLRGSASDCYLALWNRRDVDEMRVDGDSSVLDLWRERATVRWS